MTYGIGTYQEAYRRFCDGEAMGVEFSFSDWGRGRCGFAYSHTQWFILFSFFLFFPSCLGMVWGIRMDM